MPNNITAHVGQTKNGEARAELWENDERIATMYCNADATKIRIVLPELRGYGQTLVSPDNRMLEFTRKA